MNFEMDYLLSNALNQPLAIVLDEDDDEDDYLFKQDRSSSDTSMTYQAPTTNKPTQSSIENCSPLNKSKVYHRPLQSSTEVDESIRTIILDSGVAQPRLKPIALRKTPSTSVNKTKKTSTDSILSYMSFDKLTNIISISRMGSMYYCVEDLYLRAFSVFCTLEEFVDLLIKREMLLVKQVTLSEKISIEQHRPRLKKFNHTRYRLVSINSSDHLLKLKKRLSNYSTKKPIAELYKSKPRLTPVVATKSTITTTTTNLRPASLSNKPDDHGNTQFGIFIQCNGNCNIYPTNDRVSSRSTADHGSESDNNRSNEQFQSSLPWNDHSTDDSHNQSDLYTFPSKPTDPVTNLCNTNSDALSLATSSSSNLLSKSSLRLKPRNNARKGSFRDSPNSERFSTPTLNIVDHTVFKSQPEMPEVTDESYSMPMVVDIEENVPFVPEQMTNPVQFPSLPANQTVLNKTVSSTPRSHPNNGQTNRLKSSEVLRDILLTQPMTSRINANSPLSLNAQSNPTISFQNSSTKIYFAPISNPQESSINTSRTSPTLPVTSSFFPNLQTQSVTLPKAIKEHDCCDIDGIPKLLIRHTKTYAKKTVNTMGQLFPTWFGEPHYRCIHCFTCDQVFTPQLFMTHVDDKDLAREKPETFPPIQLLTSEILSQSKIKLWNDFCKKLSTYANQIVPLELQKKKDNSSKKTTNHVIPSKRQRPEKPVQKTNFSIAQVPIVSILNTS